MCSSVSLSLSFVVVVVVVVRISAFGRADSTELKNSILSVKKNVLNTHTRARVRVHCARARIFIGSIYYSFRCIEGMRARVRTRSDLTKCIFFFPLTFI